MKNAAHNWAEGDPLHLTASTIVRSNTTSPPNIIALKCPLDRPMAIHEIRWVLYGDHAFPGSTIGCRLNIGNIEVTNGFVPVWLFGSAEQSTSSPQSQSQDRALAWTFVWKLASPIYVPVGGILRAEFAHLGLANFDITARIGYAASMIDSKVPNNLYIPYAMSYLSKSFPIDTADTDESKETDLFNTTGSPLCLQRLVSRAHFFVPAAVEGIDVFAEGREQIQDMIQVKIIDSDGNPIIRDFSRMSCMFNNLTCSWELHGAYLRDNMFYKVYLNKTAPNVNFSTNSFCQTGIGLIGWRQMRKG